MLLQVITIVAQQNTSCTKKLLQFIFSCTANNYFFSFTEIEKLFNDIGKCLKDFPTMPFHATMFLCADNRLILKELDMISIR